MPTDHRPFIALDKPLLNCSCGDMGFTPSEFEQHRKGATSIITDERVGRAYAEVTEHAPIPDLATGHINCYCGAKGFTPNGYALHRVRVILETQ